MNPNIIFVYICVAASKRPDFHYKNLTVKYFYLYNL
jgi:hypothetical protein